MAAARLRMGARRLRALANGDAAAVRDFVQTDSALRLAEARRDARLDLEALQTAGARLVTLADAEYPAGLRDLRSAPAFLCVRGVLPVGGIAIVGSRDASAEGLGFAYELARRMERSLVSGLALGIDAAAHRGGLSSGVAQIAYVGTGIARTYPATHAGLAEAIVTSGGAIASERLPGETVTRWSLAQRDRLQAAHAQAVVLVESDAAGGAMHTMRFAHELGRRCFVRAGDGSGNRIALAQGAVSLPDDPAAAAALIHAALC
ncbi:MAG: hypothetical protein NVSMB64_15840 [Candidatus Velthaea sp.]